MKVDSVRKGVGESLSSPGAELKYGMICCQASKMLTISMKTNQEGLGWRDGSVDKALPVLCCASTRAWVQNTSTHVLNPNVTACFVIPGQGLGRQVNFSFSDRHLLLREQGKEWPRKIPDVNLWSLRTWTHMCMNTYTQTIHQDVLFYNMNA